MSDDTIIPQDDPNAQVVPDVTPEFTPVEGSDAIFKQEPTGQEMPTEEKSITIPESQFQKFINELNELKQKVNQNDVIDPMNETNRKKIVRVAFYTDESGHEYLITGFNTRTMIDGAIVNTWERGRDELTEKPITWCKPKMINIDTGVLFEAELRYDHFAAMIRTVPCEVIDEKTERIDITGIPEIVEVTSYNEQSNGRIKPVTSGTKIRTTVIGLKTIFTVMFRDTKYTVDEKVINIK